MAVILPLSADVKTGADMPANAEHPGAPRHVAIIMDGNGRWATMRGRPRLFGHHAGAKRVREIVRACPDVGVKYLTIFAFSTENWKRTQVEVAGLMSLFRRYITREARDLLAEGVRVRFIGDRVRLDLNACTLDALVPEDEWAGRKAAWVPPVIEHQTPWQEIYRQHVGQLSDGGCLELATVYRRVAQKLPRDNH